MNFFEFFVPGRVCLFGEHSDWAGGHRRTNSALAPTWSSSPEQIRGCTRVVAAAKAASWSCAPRWPLVLLIPSNILAITNAYICYTLFVFKTRGHIFREYFRCYVVYGGMMALGAVLMAVSVEGFKLSPVLANCLCIAVTTVVSYLAHRTYSFGGSYGAAASKGAKTE